MSAIELTASSRRAMSCPTCGPAFGALDPDDLSLTCAAVILRWEGHRAVTRPGCGLVLYLCPAHGLRTRREGDTTCRCAEMATPIELGKAAA